jgi:hypothetical protein
MLSYQSEFDLNANLTSDVMHKGYCTLGMCGYFQYLHEYNKFVKTKTSGNELILNIDFWCEHNHVSKNRWPPY